MRWFFFLANLVVLNFLLASRVNAHCPLCIAGAGFGLSLSRLLGIDDSVTGVWLAAFFGAGAMWLSTFPLRRIHFPLKKPLIYSLVLVSTIWSLYRFNLVDIHAGNIAGIDKLTFGYLTGGMLLYIADGVNGVVIKLHRGVYFPYQRMVVSLGSVLLLSVFNYVLINYFI